MDSVFPLGRRALLCAAAVVVSCLAQAAEKPLLRVGLMTDSHVTDARSSCDRVKAALETFRRAGVDMVVHMGDLGQQYYEEGYRFYRETVDAVYPDRAARPEMLYVYANHELYNPKGGYLKHLVAFEGMKKHVGIDNGLFEEKTVNGCTFLLFPQTLDLIGGVKAYEEKIAAACAAHPGKPIFVLDHVPAWNTVYGSCAEGDSARRRVLNRYPQVIALSGHVHNSVRNEQCIWQGEFTAVDVGGLQRWQGSSIGTSPFSKQLYDVLVMEVWPTRVVFRRMDVRDGREYRKPWVVPVPYDAATAPYAFARRAKAEKPVSFARGAEIAVKTDKMPYESVTLSFPAAERDDDVMIYRVNIARKLADGKWEEFARGDAFGEYYLRPADRKGSVSATYGTGYFETGHDYRFTVTPVGFFGTAGRPIVGTWRSPEAKAMTLVWEVKDPMRTCPLLYGSAKSAEEAAKCQRMPIKDGWFVNEQARSAFVYLPDGVWDAEPGTKLRLTAEVEMRQSGSEGCWLELRPASGGGAVTYGYTPPGESGLVCYVLEYAKRKDSPHYALKFTGGDRFSARLNRLKIERSK